MFVSEWQRYHPRSIILSVFVCKPLAAGRSGLILLRRRLPGPSARLSFVPPPSPSLSLFLLILFLPSTPIYFFLLPHPFPPAISSRNSSRGCTRHSPGSTFRSLHLRFLTKSSHNVMVSPEKPEDLKFQEILTNITCYEYTCFHVRRCDVAVCRGFRVEKRRKRSRKKRKTRTVINPTTYFSCFERVTVSFFLFSSNAQSYESPR